MPVNELYRVKLHTSSWRFMTSFKAAKGTEIWKTDDSIRDGISSWAGPSPSARKRSPAIHSHVT